MVFLVAVTNRAMVLTKITFIAAQIAFEAGRKLDLHQSKQMDVTVGKELRWCENKSNSLFAKRTKIQ